MDMKRFFLYGIVMAALALAGCGGDGGSTAPPPVQPPPAPTFTPKAWTLPQDIKGMMGLLPGFMNVTAGTYKITAGDDTGTDAGDAIFSCPSGGGNCEVTVAADGSVTYQVASDGSLGVPTVTASAAAITASTTRANAVIKGINNPDANGNPQDLGVGTSRPGTAAGGAEDFDVRPGSLGTKGTTVIGNSGTANTSNTLNFDTLFTDDMAGSPATSVPGQFMHQTNMDSTLGSFAGSVHVRTDTATKQTDTLRVYTNEEAAGDTAYGTYYSTSDADTRTGVSGATSAGVLTLTEDEAFDSMLYSGDWFPTTNGSFNPLPYEAGDNNANEISGMFNGVAGKYTCTVSACEARKNADGTITLRGGTITFTPTETDLTKIMITGVDYDADYMSFGYWVRQTEGSDGKMTYEVGTVYDGSQALVVGLAALEGKATYSGKAAGMYGRQTFKPNGEVDTATSGHFTANVKLDANFGGDDVAVNAQDRVSGSVTNFMDGNQMIDPAWTVNLMLPGTNNTGQNIVANNFTDNNVGGPATGGGNWRGTFYGNPPSDGNTDDEDNYPLGIVGDFLGHFGNGHVIGGFGATKD